MINSTYEKICKSGNRNVYYCSKCKKTFIAKTEKVNIGQKPCACGQHYYKTKSRRLFRVLESCSSKGLTLEKYDDPEKTVKQVKITYKCLSCLNSHETSWDGFIGNEHGCWSCGGSHPTSFQERKSQLDLVANSLNIEYSLIDNKVSSKSRIKVSCKNCGASKTPLISNFLSNKYRCECTYKHGFKEHIPATFYLLEFKNKTTDVIFVKFGISNVFEKRLENLKISASNYDISVLDTWKAMGCEIRIFENVCKSNFKQHINDLKDGKTECVSLEDFQTIKDMADEYFKTKEYYGFIDGH